VYFTFLSFLGIVLNCIFVYRKVVMRTQCLTTYIQRGETSLSMLQPLLEPLRCTNIHMVQRDHPLRSIDEILARAAEYSA
jgi:hypothetical protein